MQAKAFLTSMLLALAMPALHAETLKIDCDCKESSFEGGCKGTDHLRIDTAARTVTYTYFDGSEWIFDGRARTNGGILMDKGNVTRIDSEQIAFELAMDNRQSGRKSSRSWSIDRGSGEMQVMHLRADGSSAAQARYACARTTAERKF